MASKIWLTALAGLAVVSLAAPADAQRRRDRESGAHVTACSRYGHGCMTVPVRPGRFDAEYRLANGTWMPCKQSCRDALREDVIDYWETLNERAGRAGR
jgi:hypothetical protein